MKLFFITLTIIFYCYFVRVGIGDNNNNDKEIKKVNVLEVTF